MKVFLDTNIIISAMLFPEGIASKAYFKCISEYRCVVCDRTLFELRDVFKRKFKEQLPMLEVFINMMLKECLLVKDCEIPNILEDTIRDVKDRIIYRTAKESGCDAIVTGDKDFQENNELDIKILIPSDLVEV